MDRKDKHFFERKAAYTGSLRIRIRRPLHLSFVCARFLKRRLNALAIYTGCSDEVLRRLKLERGHMENCLYSAQRTRGAWLPGDKNGAYILQIARDLIADGEKHLSREEIRDRMRCLDSAGVLSMREIELLPDAICIALCEAFCRLCDESLKTARMRLHAQKWVHTDGKKKPVRRLEPAFYEYALQMAAECERPELRAGIERLIERSGEKPAHILEYAHRVCADRCLRLENMMGLWHLLTRIDWEKFFEEVSGTDMELREDPMRVYGRMDAPSRGMVRCCAEEIAEKTKVDELTVARYALCAARQAKAEHGEHDPRATVCWYLLEDTGREQLCRNLGCGCRLRRRVPDPHGTGTVLLAGMVLLFALLVFGVVVNNPLLMIFALPLCWVFAMQLIGRFYPLWLKPNRIVRLEMKNVPDCARTLVVLPVLLSSVERTREMLAHMEALGCLEKDQNIDYLLLGDFRDADRKEMPEDEMILQIGRDSVAVLNENEGRKKYFYLHRERSFREKDRRWMGENRKRGALMALNRLLLMRNGAELSFSEEGECAAELAGRYRYVVTLDADTEYLPGDIKKLVGAIHHPLNRVCTVDGRRRGYAVLQPDMQLMPENCTNAYVNLTAGVGGMDCYPVSVSDFYQDMTGYGNFAGKGIYDIRAFSQAMEGVLQDDSILSHDLIEGILSGAGYLNDVHFYDGAPESLQAELTRLHRWTRGDWQLLPVLFSGLRIRAVDRMKMLGNLFRSLYAPALLGLLLFAIWLDAPAAFALGLALAFQIPLLQLPHLRKKVWKAALFRFAVLPAEAACTLDAVLRTLWRLTVSHEHLMDWVPAADARRKGSGMYIPGRIAGVLLMPGLLRPFWIPAVLALMLLFFIGANWAEDLSNTPVDDRSTLDRENVLFLEDLARRTWSFFERYVPEDSCGFPPDNVQMDPPVGVAKRTSPTNIGLYLMSCISARELGFIDETIMMRRIAVTVDTLEKLEKWNGQLYNWYDIDDLSPLKPRYVSAVDSGNLAGTLLLCAHVLREKDEELAGRIQELAEGMDLAALYDKERKLFRIGMDVESGRASESHYDLYASEARILSYAAMMLGQVPVEHWKHLSRAGIRLGRGQALASWSGTMFEYLMPEILFRSFPNTLAGQSRKGMLACQMEWGRRLGRPWGVSESGYYAFDLRLNYQYRAFGLRELALGGSVVQDVVAPYAAMLALVENPEAAVDNLRKMCEMGWDSEYGMYEAADYLHLESGQRPKLVRSYMAHHQGMALCAMCNALRNDILSRRFMEIPGARALRLLLQEREAQKLPERRRSSDFRIKNIQEHGKNNHVRSVRRDERVVDCHLLSAGGTTLLVNDRGGAFVWRGNVQMNRFSGRLFEKNDGMYIHLHEKLTGENIILGNAGRMMFDLGNVHCSQDIGPVRARMQIAVSPEDGSVYQSLELENRGDEVCELIVSGCFSVALAPQNDMRAHPIFQNLFVESTYRKEGVLVFQRRRRDGKEPLPELVYLISGGEEIEFETDYEKLVGRTGSVGLPGGLKDFTGSTGCVLNPCAALRTKLHIEGGERRKLHFALAMTKPEEQEAYIESMIKSDAPERAVQLAGTQMRVVLEHAGIDVSRFKLYQRISSFIFDGSLCPYVSENREAAAPSPRNLMWKAGISGDLPILLVEFEDSGMECVREGMRLHAFFKLMGVQTDLVLINNHRNDYYQEARGTVNDLLASSHLNGQLNARGGVFVLEKQNVDAESERAIRRTASIYLNGNTDVEAQLRSMLDVLAIPKKEPESVLTPAKAQLSEKLEFFNGYGGFGDDAYKMLVNQETLPPAPWSNILASEHAGALVTERCGGFAWFMNSRSGRLTRFANDALHEGWGWMFYLMDADTGSWLRLLPGNKPMTEFVVSHRPGESCWQGRTGQIAFEIRMQAVESGVCFEIHFRNEGNDTRRMQLAGFVDWLMGTDAADAGMVRSWAVRGACFASGTMEGVGCFVCDDPRSRSGCDRMTLFSGGDMMTPLGLDRMDIPRGGWTLHLPLYLECGKERTCRFLLGCGRDEEAAYTLVRNFRLNEGAGYRSENWRERLENLCIHTPDKAVNLLANGFLQAQILNGRIRARTGLYQPGGAFGFRDQLQDMLPMLHYEPNRVRRHLLYCAARQFEEGDVLHWWHEPYSGVRTKISDDFLFLPYVTAKYVQFTGDEAVLWESVPFLQNINIPEGKEDIYADMHPSKHFATLHEHCMRAFRHAARTGEHGLCLMGAGDWNDGMNRVGIRGRGESIWLSEFLAACAGEYACVAPNREDREWLMELKDEMIGAVEKNGWDGEWYLRAFDDTGEKLGGRSCACCSIDAISQAWAVLAGMDRKRCESAMNAAWEWLADENLKLIRLLTPPFDAQMCDPGYIASYPEGVRENGAQYTHAACWVLYALAEIGDAQRAHKALEMLLPINHALAPEDAENYRVEPYVMAADIYSTPRHAGRGGWTWYTGSAGWMLLAILKLLGYVRAGEKVRLNALLGNWEEVRLELRHGSSRYCLICRKDAQSVMLDEEEVMEDFITLRDDGKDHIAVFPPKKPKE